MILWVQRSWKQDGVLLITVAIVWKNRLSIHDGNGFKELGQVVPKTVHEAQKNVTQFNLLIRIQNYILLEPKIPFCESFCFLYVMAQQKI